MFGTGCHVAELDKILSRDMQYFTASVQFEYSPFGNGIQWVRYIGQPCQHAGVDQMGHYSYSPSLLTASLDRDTPQSVAASSNFRSQSSRGCSASASRARAVGAGSSGGKTSNVRRTRVFALSPSAVSGRNTLPS